MRITSASNPRIKALAHLLERKAREREGKFLIEGAREIGRAIEAGFELELGIVGESLNPEETGLYHELSRIERLGILELSQAPLAKLSSRENPAGVLAVARMPQGSLEDYRPASDALILIAGGLEKPGNLGAILRSAAAAGVHTVIVVGGVDLYNPQVIRNSTGVIFSLPTVGASEREVLDWVGEHQVALVATTPHTDTLYWQADLRGKVGVVVGPEHEGLSQIWLDSSDVKVRIPMQGQADSLNVSVSAALLLYEALRQRI